MDVPPAASPTTETVSLDQATEAALIEAIASEATAPTTPAPAPAPSLISDASADMEQLLQQAQKELMSAPPRVQFALGMQALARQLFDRLAKEAAAAGQVDAKGNPVIDPQAVVDQLVYPLVEFLARDLQSLEVLALDDLVNLLIARWTAPAEMDNPQG